MNMMTPILPEILWKWTIPPYYVETSTKRPSNEEVELTLDNFLSEWVSSCLRRTVSLKCSPNNTYIVVLHNAG